MSLSGFSSQGLYLPGLIIALCGRVPLRLIGRFFRRSNGRQKVLLSPRFANRNGLNALLSRKSCLRTSSSSLTNLQLVSNDDRYERYLHNGFVYSWRRRGSLECQVLNWMPLFVRLVFGLDFFHPFGWQISASRATFPWWHSRTLNNCGRFAFVERTTRVPSKSLSVFELFSRIKSHVKMALFVK